MPKSYDQQCEKCNCVNDTDKGVEWFWVSNTRCSVCFPPRRIVGPGHYSRKVTDDDWRSDHRVEPHIRQVRVMR